MKISRRQLRRIIKEELNIARRARESIQQVKDVYGALDAAVESWAEQRQDCKDLRGQGLRGDDLVDAMLATASAIFDKEERTMFDGTWEEVRLQTDRWMMNPCLNPVQKRKLRKGLEDMSFEDLVRRAEEDDAERDRE